MIMDIEDILVRIENSSPVDDSWHDLRCRLTDSSNEIQALRAKVASAEVLVGALREAKLALLSGVLPYESVRIIEKAIAKYEKLSEVKHD